MTIFNKSTVLMLISIGIHANVLAQTATNVPTNTPSSSPQPEICQPIVKVCEAAGFMKNAKPDKNLMLNCMQPLLEGKQVANVNAPPEQLDTCKKEISSSPCVKILNQCYSGGFTGGPKKLPMFDCLLPLINGTPVNNVTPEADDVSACKVVMQKQISNDPCLRVMIACKNAGYSPDQVNGEAFARNCFSPIVEGKQVQNVIVDDATAKACKAMSSSSTQAPALQ